MLSIPLMFANPINEKWPLVSAYNCIILISSEADYVLIFSITSIKSLGKKTDCVVVLERSRKVLLAQSSDLWVVVLNSSQNEVAQTSGSDLGRWICSAVFRPK
jgi:hypothetical protein